MKYHMTGWDEHPKAIWVPGVDPCRWNRDCRKFELWCWWFLNFDVECMSDDRSIWMFIEQLGTQNLVCFFFWSWHGCLVGSISVVVLYFIPKLNEGELTWNHSKMKASYIIYNIYITCFPLNGSNEDRLKSYSQLCCLNHPFRPYFFRLSGDDIGQQSQLYEINLCKSIK